MKSSSLKSALLKSITLPLLSYVVLIGGFAYYSTVSNIDEVYDANMITAANVLFFLTQHELTEDGRDTITDMDISDQNLPPEERAIFDQHADWREFRIWHQGKLALYSDNALPATIGPSGEGFSAQRYDGDKWRIFTLSVPQQNILVEIGEQQAAREYIISGIVGGLLWPFVWSLPFAAWLFSRALGWGLSGLHKVTRQINTRSPESMTALPTSNIPSDLLPLVEAVNRLLSKLSASLDRERQLTDHAAHELRTPLSVLKLQTQMAKRAASEGSRNEALDALLEGVDRASHVIDQLLTLARIKHQDFPLEEIDVIAAARKAVDTLKPLLESKHINVIFEGAGVLRAMANQQLFSTLFINVASNAIKYSPSGSSIRVQGEAQGKTAMVRVTDEGNGIPEAERERVFERFYRGGQEATGSGLGLAIAAQCALQINAAIQLETPASGIGLCVKLEMPTA